VRRVVDSLDPIHNAEGVVVVRGATPLGRLYNFSQIGDPAGDCREQDEFGFRMTGNDFGKRRFTGTWRPPEDDGRQHIALDGPAQRPIRSDNVILPYEIGKILGAHPFGERRTSLIC
jgi:hypothetical protein